MRTTHLKETSAHEQSRHDAGPRRLPQATVRSLAAVVATPLPGSHMRAVLPLWIVIILMLQAAAISAIITATVVTQRRLNQDARLLEQLILGSADVRDEQLLERLILGSDDVPAMRRPWWKRVWNRE